MRRRFNRRERRALWIIQHGYCAGCGALLQPGWHADHVVPFAHGGETDLVNAQALCPECNRRKGASMYEAVRPWPAELVLHDWQVLAQERYKESRNQTFTVVAATGTGKTRLAHALAHQSLRAGDTSRVVIVVPREHLLESWAIEFARSGLKIDPHWSADGAFTPGYHGVAITYQKAVTSSHVLRALCQRENVLVIFDEIHHAGDRRSWGKAIRDAFEWAVRVICLSGTPFRTDRQKIPFLRYREREDGTFEVEPDFHLSLRDAITQNLVRIPVFPLFDGKVRFIDGPNTIDAVLSELVSERGLAAKGLVTALQPDGGMFEKMFRHAHHQLLQIRAQEIPDAAGFVICMTQEHARRTAKAIQKIAGVDPVLVISEDADAARKLREFRNSTDPWLVAVDMVTEGYDAPRLCVGVYLSNKRTHTYFRQWLGRFIRRTEEPPIQHAFLYVPDFMELRELVEAVYVEVGDWMFAEETDEKEPSDGPTPPRQYNLFLPLGSSGELSDIIVHTQDARLLRYEKEQISRAIELYRRHFHKEPSTEHLLVMLVALDDGATGREHVPLVGSAEPQGVQQSPVPAYQYRRALLAERDRLSKMLLQRLTRHLGYDRGDQDARRTLARMINIRLHAVAGARSVKEISDEQLEMEIECARRWIDELDRAVRGGTFPEWWEAWQRDTA